MSEVEMVISGGRFDGLVFTVPESRFDDPTPIQIIQGDVKVLMEKVVQEGERVTVQEKI